MLAYINLPTGKVVKSFDLNSYMMDSETKRSMPFGDRPGPGKITHVESAGEYVYFVSEMAELNAAQLKAWERPGNYPVASQTPPRPDFEVWVISPKKSSVASQVIFQGKDISSVHARLDGKVYIGHAVAEGTLPMITALDLGRAPRDSRGLDWRKNEWEIPTYSRPPSQQFVGTSGNLLAVGNIDSSSIHVINQDRELDFVIDLFEEARMGYIAGMHARADGRLDVLIQPRIPGFAPARLLTYRLGVH